MPDDNEGRDTAYGKGNQPGGEATPASVRQQEYASRATDSDDAQELLEDIEDRAEDGIVELSPEEKAELEARLDVPVGEEFDGFDVFVVGGGVRDALRGKNPEDIDLMAVPDPGEIDDPVEALDDRMTMIDPESTIPVFMDSHGREVALPRTEEDAGAGHKGFDMEVVDSDTPVGEAVLIDLERRDLTVNAMAYDARNGTLYDPHGGKEDLEAGVVRHVSDAFREDPLRVVRLDRFAPRLDADVAPETQNLAREVSTQRTEDGEYVLESLPVERVTKEYRKAVKQAPDAGRFFEVLDDVNALDKTFPGIDEAGASVETVSTAVTESRNAASKNDRGDASFAAVGDVLGEDVSHNDGESGFANDQNLTRQERATVHAGRRRGADVRRFSELDAKEAIETYGDIRGERGASPEAHVAAAEGTARARGESFDRDAVESRMGRAERAFTEVDGATVMEEEGVRPDEIGGEAFRELLDERRARHLDGGKNSS